MYGVVCMTHVYTLVLYIQVYSWQFKLLLNICSG